MLELIFVLLIAAILLGIAGPRLLETNARVALTSASARVTAAVSLARAGAARYGRVSYLVFDVAADRLEMQVDTSILGGAPPVALHSVDLWDELAVNLRATEPLLCFDPRGLTVSSGTCTGTGVVVRLERAGQADSVVVSATGRVVR